MAETLDATVGGLVSDSYVTRTEADAFFADHFLTAKATAWSALSDNQKDHVLRTACHIIETLPFHDNAIGLALWNQALSFPRNVDLDPDWSEYVIPPVVKDAQCEQAMYLLSVDEAAMAAQMQGITSEAVGGDVSIRTTYRGEGSLVAPMALSLLRAVIRSRTRLYRA